MPDPRILRTVTNLMKRQREDFDELFGSGDHRKLAMFLYEQVLNKGEVYAPIEHDGHAIIRLTYGGNEYDCDLYADALGHAEPVRVGLADDLFRDVMPLGTHRLTEGDFDTLEAALTRSGPMGYGDILSKVRELRLQVRKQRESLS